MALKSNYSGKTEAGCDEVGRGCLAGPVVAAAVILPIDFQHDDIKDSKQLSEFRREQLSLEIEKVAIDFSIAEVGQVEIDKINIASASIRAMSEAIKSLRTKPAFLLIDGNRFTGYPGIQHKCIVKGDSKYLSIAAASILAKVYRDKLMRKLGEEYPQYGWSHNAGYATKDHKSAIEEFGPTPIHRKSFLNNLDQLSIFDQ